MSFRFESVVWSDDLTFEQQPAKNATRQFDTCLELSSFQNEEDPINSNIHDILFLCHVEPTKAIPVVFHPVRLEVFANPEDRLLPFLENVSCTCDKKNPLHGFLCF